MRIVAIRGARLASLHEPFEVDFEQEPLAGAGLFAITGPTGAGKSTLLDAVCLALYGDTPRVHGHGGADIALGLDEPDKDQRLGAKDPRHLLSRGSKRGHAEVDFRGQDGVHYRARWEVEPRPQVGDLDAADMSLLRIADGKVLASGLTTTRKKVVQLVGFTFEEFQKAVLLPQGQFAEFLRASAKERADILEKIAGGEIYTRLGNLAAARLKVEQAALVQLEAEAAGHHPLADAERDSITADRDRAEAELTAARERERSAREAMAWHDGVASLANAVAEAEAKLALAVKAQAAAGPRRAELEAVERALVEREVLTAVARAEEVLAGAIADCGKKVKEATDAARRSKEAGREVGDAEAARAAVEAEVARTRPEIEEAKRLDAELVPARRVQDDAASAERTAIDHQRMAKSEVAKVVATSHRHEQARDEAERWLSGHASEAAVAAEWRHWREVIERHGAAVSAARAARQRRDAAATPEAVEQARVKALEAAQEGDRAVAEASAASAARDAAEATVREAEGWRDSAKAALQRARDAQGLSARRAELRPGEACPLCGATEHPWAGQAEVDALVTGAAEAARGCDAALAAAKRELTRSRAAAEETGKVAAATAAAADALSREATTLEKELARAGRDAAEAELARAEAEATACEATLAAAFDGVPGWREALAARPAALLADWHGRVKAHAERRAARDAAADALSVAGPNLAAAEATAKEKAEAVEAAAGRLVEARAEVERLEAARSKQIGGRPAAEVERQLAERLRELDRCLDVVRKAAAKAETESAGAVARQAEAAARQASAEAGARDAAQALAAALTRLRIDRAVLQQCVLKGDKFVSDERKALVRIDEAERHAATLLDERRRAVEAHCASRPALDRPAAEAALGASAQESRMADARRVEAEASLVADARARTALVALGPRLDAQRARTRLAAQLGDLIGQGGNKSFRAFAQGLALDVLLVHANHHLEQLAPRYRLSRVPGHDMELQVLDEDFGGAARGVNSLSGGETFLVSLGLALGLSGLATRAARVESLFIDEGFGTLDPETLEQAMEVLEGLRATGRTVGIISHVPELHDRIGVLIQVEKIGAGRSRVRAVRSDEAQAKA